MSASLRVSKTLSVPLEYATDATAILGKRGSGKTNTAVVAVEEMVAAGIPVVVVDTVGVWWGLRSSADGEKPGLPVIVFGGEHGDVPLEEKSGEIIADAILDHGLSAVVDTSGLGKAAAKRFLLKFVTRIYHRKASDRTPLHVVFDEADELAPQRPDSRSGPEGVMLLSAMEDFVRRGRSRGLGCTLVTQRPAVLNKDVLTQVETLIAMRMTGTLDIKAIDDWTRASAAEDDDAATVKATLHKLETGTGWVWSPQWLNIFEQVTFRQRTTFDSSATPKIGEVRVEPKARAEVDLAKLGEQIAATVEKAKADDPKRLRQDLANARAESVRLQGIIDSAKATVEVVEKVVEVPIVTAHELAELAAIRDHLTTSTQGAADTIVAGVRDAIEQWQKIERAIAARTAPSRPEPTRQDTSVRAAVGPQRPAAAPPARPASNIGQHDAGDADVVLRAGARRMVETLGRMAPLRLTKAQWGTVSRMKTTSGTWSTYLGDIRRLGLLDENDIGYTLTEAGFDYLGGRPEPMTPEELQQHYRKILRAGAVRMLDAIMHWYPDVITRDDLGEETSMVTTSGTFSTYLGDLVRNGLVDKVDGGYVATDVLMKGAAA